MTELTPRPTPRAEPEKAKDPVPYPRRDPIEALPVLVLYPHSRCNCRCVMCEIWRVTTREEIEPEEVAEWLPELRELGVRRVVLSGGEALLHSRLWELCGVLGREGIGISLVTTGLLLERDAREVVAHSDDVVVSLDGPRELHNEIRRIPTAYEKLARGVEAVRAADPERRVRLSARCTVQRRNFRHLCATVEAAWELGLDRISFLAADVTSEAFNRPGGWDGERRAEVAVPEEELPRLEAELDAMEEEWSEAFEGGFIAEGPEKLRRRLLEHFTALAGRGPFPGNATCNAPWVSSVVESDGTVRPCFFQPPLGNVREAGSLKEVLNSEAAVAWRRGLDPARNEICRRCVCSLTLREGADLREGEGVGSSENGEGVGALGRGEREAAPTREAPSGGRG